MDGHDDEAAQLQALLGFSTFGQRTHKRQRRTSPEQQQQQQQQQQQRVTGERVAPTQVIPGTTLSACEQRFSTREDVASDGRCGVLFLKTHDVAPLTHAMTRDRPQASSAVQPSEESLGLPTQSMALLTELAAAKQQFEQIDTALFRRARKATNPFESLGRYRFVNRSALKMVNLDSMFDLTRALRTSGKQLTFADVCGGPGGFSEYLLWRARQQAVQHKLDSEETHAARTNISGFGISLVDDICGWKIADELGRFRICYGRDGTGDLYQLPNIHEFAAVVHEAHPSGVELVVADGGFAGARDQANQEKMMERLVLAETLTMFHVLAEHGNFVCKTFEISTSFMLQLAWLIRASFRQFTVVKPVTSRPASSERYIVALDRLPYSESAAIIERLERCLQDTSSCDLGIEECVRQDQSFLEFAALTSDRLATCQLEACQKIHICARTSQEHQVKRTAQELAQLKPTDFYTFWNLPV